MIYQQLDNQNLHIGQVAEQAPGAVDVPKPVYDKATHRARWVDNDWDIRTHAEWDSILNPPQPEPTIEELNESIRLQRQMAYQKEADPLFFKWQASEGTEADWLAKREEIRIRYPEVTV